MTRDVMSDTELDRLLALATVPAVPEGAEARLMARLAQVEAGETVVTFKPRQRRLVPWLSALPLAASLACGIYLGAAGFADPYMTTSDTVAAMDDSAAPGLDDMLAISEGSAS
jgi:hypothetical protein